MSCLKSRCQREATGGMLHDVGPFRTTNPHKSQTNSSYEDCSHFRDIFENIFKIIFKMCSYIQKNPQNPNMAVKITIYNTK